MKIRQTPIPSATLAAKSFSPIHYQDAFACTFSCDRQLRVEEVVKAFFSAAPPWVEKLFLLRNKLAGLVGLKVSGAGSREEQLQAFRVEKGEALGLFRVMEKVPGEVLLGEDDRHLNFRISFLLAAGAAPGTYDLVLSTTVFFHNWFGRLYFLPVKPFHKLIVPGMMRGIVRELQKGSGKFPAPAAKAELA